MTHRFPAATARVSQLPLHRIILSRIILSLIVGSLTLASAGCSHFGAKPISANPPTQQQMETYAEQQTALRNNASNPDWRNAAKLRSARHGHARRRRTSYQPRHRREPPMDAYRKWLRSPLGFREGSRCLRRRLGAEAWPRQARFPTAPRTCSRGGIQPLPGLRSGPEPRALAESEKSAAIREVFGAPQGEFTWRGRKYSYTLTPELPCFPQLQ